MKNDAFLLILYFLQEGVNSRTPESVDNLRGFPIPKTFEEIIGAGVILFLSPAVFGTMISAWGNRTAIKDEKTKTLEKKIEEKNEESYKKDIQLEILKVRLENTEKRNQELQTENRELKIENKELKEQTNTGFTRQEQALRDHINNLKAEIESLKNR